MTIHPATAVPYKPFALFEITLALPAPFADLSHLFHSCPFV
jgi:hypothetical protein